MPAPATQARSDRLWIWAALTLQLLGYAVDVVWHGLVNPGVEPTTVSEMARHLLTVHALLYLGAACVLLAILRAVAHRARRSGVPVAPHAAGAGALVVALGARCSRRGRKRGTRMRTCIWTRARRRSREGCRWWDISSP